MSMNYPPSPSGENLNPYAAPDALIGDVPHDLRGDLTEAEAIRKRYLRHEASVKSVGSLHWLGAFFTISAFMAAIVSMVSSGGPARPANRVLFFAPIIAIYGIFSAYNIALGIGLMNLQTWARWVEAVMQGLGMLLLAVALVVTALSAEINRMQVAIFCFGGLLGGYILYLMVSPRGAMVFSPEYKDVIAKTPHIKYRTSCLVKLVVAAFLAIVVLAILGGIIAYVQRSQGPGR